MLNLNPLAGTLIHRKQLLEEIAMETTALNETFDAEKINFLKEKIVELEETNKLLERRKDQLKKDRRCCECRLIHWLRGTVIGTFATVMALGISRLAIKYSHSPVIACSNSTVDALVNAEGALADAETIIGFIFAAVASWHELVAGRTENEHRRIHEASTIETYGEESYEHFLSSLEQYRGDRRKETLKECIHSLDRMPKSRLNQSLVRQRLIPLLIKYLPEEDEIVIRLNRLKDDGRRIHLQISSTEPELVREGSSTESGSNPFAGEKSPISALSDPFILRKSSLENRSPLEDYRSGWKELEDELDTRLDALEYDGHIFRNDGLIEQVTPEERIIEFEERL